MYGYTGHHGRGQHGVHVVSMVYTCVHAHYALIRPYADRQGYARHGQARPMPNMTKYISLRLIMQGALLTRHLMSQTVVYIYLVKSVRRGSWSMTGLFTFLVLIHASVCLWPFSGRLWPYLSLVRPVSVSSQTCLCL